MSGTYNARRIGLDRYQHAEAGDGLSGARQHSRDRIGVLWFDDRHHADSAIERAQHFGLGNAAKRGEPAEDGEHRHPAKIERDPANPRRILTVWGRGYKLVPEENEP